MLMMMVGGCNDSSLADGRLVIEPFPPLGRLQVYTCLIQSDESGSIFCRAGVLHSECVSSMGFLLQLPFSLSKEGGELFLYST